MNVDWRARYDLAVTAAQQAGKFALDIFHRGFDVEWKADQTPVTVADQGAERLIRDMVTKHFPADGFLGEEYGDQPGSSGYRWVIDPIDGTRSFVRGVPIWGPLVGIEHRGEMIAGVCGLPAFDQIYRALRGDGAYRDDTRIRVSDVATLDKAHVCYSSVRWFHKAGQLDRFMTLCDRTERQRGFGDFYGFMLVAQGAFDMMIDHGVHAWDVAAPLPIVEEAGGLFTTWAGEKTIHAPDVLASNGKLHAPVQDILAGKV
jgi:histidinol-phosphatase